MVTVAPISITDLLDALERVGKHILSAARLSKKRRDELLTVLTETYELLDRVLLMVIGRIGRVIDRAERNDRQDFARELSNLAWDEEWLQSTRELSLSSALRRMHSEMKRAPTRFLTRRAVRDWDALKEMMRRTMHDEMGLARVIADGLDELSTHAKRARSSDEGFRDAWDRLTAARRAFENERRRLVMDSAEIYDVL